MNYAMMLFVCVENAGRSLMAEAFLKKYAPHVRARSAGTCPAERPNPVVVEAMREVGIVIDAKPQSLTTKMVEDAACVVNMGCMDSESCPALFVGGVQDWAMPDPRGKGIEDVRKIRDAIEERVKEMVKSL